MLKKPITIDGWQAGIGSSPHTGFEYIFNADIFNVDGVVKPGFKLFQGSDAPVNSGSGLSFTGTTGTNIIAVSGGSFAREINNGGQSANGRAVQVSGGSLPSGLSAATTYFIINDSSGTSFKLSATLGGSAISIGNGSGTITSVDPAQINYFAYNKDTNLVYGQDVNGMIWQYVSGFWELLVGNTLPTAGQGGQGLICWQNYLMAFRNGNIDCYGPLNGSPSWTNAGTGQWTGALLYSGTVNSYTTIYHQPFKSSSNVLYWADATIDTTNNYYKSPYVGNILQIPAKVFAPGDNTTWTLTTQIAGLPTSDVITCLEQLGTNIMAATSSNTIYPLSNTTPVVFGLPIWAAENYIHSMVNINNVLYFSAGNKGNIYKTYGTYAVNVVDFSDYLSGFPQFTVFETQLAKYQSRLMFAISQANPNAGGAITAADQISGVYSLNLGAGETSAIGANTAVGYCMDFQTSGGLGVYIPDILVASDLENLDPNTYDLNREFNVFVSWKTVGASTQGIDCLENVPVLGSTTPCFRATGNLCQIASKIEQIGTANEPQTPERFLLNLTKPLANGESITIQFRNNDTVGGSWSTGTTFTGTATPSAPTISTTSGEALGGGIGLRDSVNVGGAVSLENCIWLQALITLNAASATAYACPELRNVEIY